MKKGISWLLLITFCLPALGTWGLFTCQQRSIRREIKQKIKAGVPLEQQTILAFTESEMERSDFNWLNDHEFKFHGTAYDVLSQKKASDRIYFYCIRDEDETRLFKALDEQVSQIMNQDGASKERRQNTFRFYKNLFCLTEKPATLRFNRNVSGPDKAMALINADHIPDTPPPESFHFSLRS